ncbi:MAG: hypothetical protein M5U26_27850 [Planctomycetota bacterium]|nr:hypothetical protein [Planctomycetota bacterium]
MNAYWKLVAVAIAGLGLGAVQVSAADSLILKNGTILEGELVNYTPQQAEVVINTGIRSTTLQRGQIRQVQLDDASRQEFARQFNALDAKDAKGHFELYKWAKSKRMYSFADQALQTTLKADPQHAQARKVLGHVYRDGRWLSAEEAAKLPASAKAEESWIIGETQGGDGTTRAVDPEKAQFERKVLEQARILGKSDSKDEDKEVVVAEFVRDRERVGDALLGCLDFRRVADEEVRLGALKGLKVVKSASPRTPPSLAWSAVMDPRRGCPRSRRRPDQGPQRRRGRRRDDPAPGRRLRRGRRAAQRPRPRRRGEVAPRARRLPRL